MADTGIHGHEVIASVAARFPQLYIAPAEGAQDAHRQAAGRGVAPAGASLSHFVTSADDELREVETPAGPVEVIFLKNRCDFEIFLQIVGHKAQPVPIAPTVGATTYRGLADWGKVARAHREYLAAGGDDWRSEFLRLARQPGAFRSELVIISEGPYSNIAAQDAGYDSGAWLAISREIRLNHECAHVVCRRMMPDNIAPVWDEITADVVGLICATGRYEASLAARFLGVSTHGFTGGRLAEYLDTEQLDRINGIAAEVYEACTHIEQQCTESDLARPFDFLLQLKENPLIAY